MDSGQSGRCQVKMRLCAGAFGRGEIHGRDGAPLPRTLLLALGPLLELGQNANQTRRHVLARRAHWLSLVYTQNSFLHLQLVSSLPKIRHHHSFYAALPKRGQRGRGSFRLFYEPTIPVAQMGSTYKEEESKPVNVFSTGRLWCSSSRLAQRLPFLPWPLCKLLPAL